MNKLILQEDIKDYLTTDEYGYLIEHCRAIIGERVKNSREELILGHAELGEEICSNPLYKKHGKGNQDFLNKLFEDIGVGKSNGYYAIRFYEYLVEKTGIQLVSTAWKQLKDELKEGDNISWNKIKQLYLPPEKKEKIVLPEGKYRVIYADIPWKYDVDLSSGTTRSPENNYPVMDLDEIKAFGIEIEKIANKDCILFMWITAPKLNWMNDVLQAWGFDYKTNLIWDKIKPNMGHYSSVRHEILIIAGKGTCSPTCDGKTIQSVDSVQSIEKTNKHSEKPEEFRKIIEKLYPDSKKIELFARGKAPQGWVFWGNQANE